MINLLSAPKGSRININRFWERFIWFISINDISIDSKSDVSFSDSNWNVCVQIEVVVRGLDSESLMHGSRRGFRLRTIARLESAQGHQLLGFGAPCFNSARIDGETWCQGPQAMRTYFDFRAESNSPSFVIPKSWESSHQSTAFSHNGMMPTWQDCTMLAHKQDHWISYYWSSPVMI